MKYAEKSKVEPQAKSLVESVKAIGEWIKAQRERKNLTPGHVALKMGIATALILSWEGDTSKPNCQQWASLAQAFGLNADVIAFPNAPV